jgi:predicted outer membrane repeat protein
MSFGSISGNVAEKNGGGVYVEDGFFSKTGGVINGDETGDEYWRHTPYNPAPTTEDEDVNNGLPSDNTAKFEGNAYYVKVGGAFRNDILGQADNVSVGLGGGNGEGSDGDEEQ